MLSYLKQPQTADVENTGAGGGGTLTYAKVDKMLVISLGVLTTKHNHFSCQSIV